MNIFVDEAGVFNIPNNRKWSVSCVGALVIPESDTERIFRGYKRLMRSWGFFEGELKGRKLNEPEMASLINFLMGFDLIFEVVAIDMIMHSHYEIRNIA